MPEDIARGMLTYAFAREMVAGLASSRSVLGGRSHERFPTDCPTLAHEADPMSNDLSDLYRQVILDHSRHPHNLRRIEDATESAEGSTPSVATSSPST